LNGNKITGATNVNYTFTALADTNTYYVTISNSYSAGSPTVSQTATVIGIAVPQLNPVNYPYKAKITFPGYDGQPLTNFPALVTLSPSTLQGLEFSQFETNGADIRFTDASGTGLLPSEVDEWNVGGVSTIWVLVPYLNGTNIWAYWGNSTPTNTPPAGTNVWVDSDYQIVYHLKETAPPYADSTGQYPATAAPNGTATTQTNGVVGHGQAFNGTSSILSPGQVTLSNQFTTYVWAYLNGNAPAQIQTLWCNQEGNYGNNGFAEFINSYNTDDNGILIASGDNVNPAEEHQVEFAGAFSPAHWHLLSVDCDSVNQTFTCFLDGSVVGTPSGFSGDLQLTNALYLGAFLNPNFWWTGNMDEARIQYGLASTNWQVTTYQNMANAGFLGYSSINNEPFVSITSSTNGFALTWPTNDGSFILESTTNLGAPSSWQPVTSPTPVATNGEWEVVIPIGAGSNEFYRLQGQ
jgi:hypothetical protein